MDQLLLDLAGQGDEHRIHELVAERLSSFGKVTGLKILDQPEHGSTLILITMGSPQAAASAINHLGLLSFGECSMVIVVPNGHS